MRVWVFLLALVLGSCAAAPVAAQAVAAKPAVQSWANSRSDLPLDPDYTLGVLPNGMRYLILPNANPPGMTAMRLVITAGSMQERPGQEGSAHFLEHMAFRGTKQIPDGEIQRMLGKLGLEMGRDVNASTGSDEIVFQFDMARSDADAAFTGLMILRQIASELVLDPAALEVERGVVLAEERLRAGPQLDAAIGATRQQVGDHPYGLPPIGKREAVLAMTPSVLRRFYEEYFRPERATLILVGDVDAAKLKPVIESQFGDWVGVGPAGGDPKPLTKRPVNAPATAMVVGQGQGFSQLRLVWWEPYRDEDPTKAGERQRLVENLAIATVNQRMQSLNEAAGRPTGSLSAAGFGRIGGVWNGSSASASQVTDLPKTIDLLVKANRQAVQYGVSQAELDRIKELRSVQLAQSVKAGRNGPSNAYADMTARALTRDPVFVSLADTQAMQEAQMKTVTVDEVNAVLKAHFNGSPSVFYNGVKAPEGGEAGLRRMVDAAMAAPVQPYQFEAVKPWPYTDFGKPGQVAERREDKELGVTMLRFANGVRLTVKSMGTPKDEISVRVLLGHGRMDMPRDRIDASDAGEQFWSQGGLNKLTRPELSRVLAGKRATRSTGSGEDAFTIDTFVPTSRQDFTMQMQLMAATVTDPAYRTDTWPQMLKQQDDADAGTTATPQSALSYHLPRLLHDGDIRWTFNTSEQRHSWKPEDSVAFIRPIVATSPIEVVIAGDTDVETAIGVVAATFGALPARAERPEKPGARDVKFPAPTANPVTITHTGRADQAIMVMAWPTNQGLLKDMHARRVGYVLSQLLQDRATLKFRSGEGTTYSPTATGLFSASLPDYGYISITCELPPERVAGAMADVQALADQLAMYEVSEDELSRTIGPRVEAAKRDMASNQNYWLDWLAGAQADPRRLELIRTQVSDYQTITAAEVKAAAAKWLRADTAFKVQVVKGN